MTRKQAERAQAALAANCIMGHVVKKGDGYGVRCDWNKKYAGTFTTWEAVRNWARNVGAKLPA